MSQSTLFEPGASTLAYQIYVELEGVRPKVWRRFLVPDTIELPRLHVTLLGGDRLGRWSHPRVRVRQRQLRRAGAQP